MAKAKTPEHVLAALKYGYARGISKAKLVEVTGMGLSTIGWYIAEDFSFRRARAEYQRATMEEIEMILDEGLTNV